MAIATTQAKCALVVARTGSFRRAASELYMSQPAVSATIASLERALGVRLFERTPSGALPTKDGVMVMPHLRAFLASQEVLLREAARLVASEPEPLLMSSHRDGLTHMLPPALRVLRAAAGPVAVRIHLFDPAEALTAAMNGSIELALSYRAAHRPLQDDRVVEFVTSTSPTVLFFPPGHRFEQFEVITPDDMADETVIINAPSSPSSMYSRWYLRKTDGVQWCETPDVPSALALVAAGVGVVVLPDASSALEPGLPFRPMRNAVTVAYTMIRRADRPLSAAGRMVWELLTAQV